MDLWEHRNFVTVVVVVHCNHLLERMEERQMLTKAQSELNSSRKVLLELHSLMMVVAKAHRKMMKELWAHHNFEWVVGEVALGERHNCWMVSALRLLGHRNLLMVART